MLICEKGKCDMKNKLNYKSVMALVCTFCIIVATFGGVIAANSLMGAGVGSSTGDISSLDAIPEGEVGVVNILLLGVDEGGYRSDTIMIANINGYTNEVNILSVPRDTRIALNNGRNHVKINSAIGIGIQETNKGNYSEPEDYAILKIKELTGLPIHYFMTIDFEAFKDIIDTLGGVDFEVPFRMKYDDPVQDLHIDLQPGMQHLDGQAAHDFVRFRQGNPGYQGYAMGDLGRIEAQQAFLKALVEQKAKPEYIAKATELYEIICQYVRTNYTVRDLVRHLSVANKLTSDNVKMYQLPGHSQTIGGGSYFIVDSDELQTLVDTVFDSNRRTPLD